MNFFIGDKEKKLVKQLRHGNSTAMHDFYALYADYLTGICARYVGNGDSLKDVLQDCLVNIITHVGEFEYRGAGSLQAWATKIAVNQSLKFLKEQKHGEFVTLEWDVPDSEKYREDEEDPPISDIPPDVIHRFITELPTGYRTVFNLYVFENKSHQEIAATLGIKKDSSASQLHRAKSLLAKKIEQYNTSKQRAR